ncbi:post-GPI attachment to proteins factor 2 isoform X1 [Drosophila teissieri]|uniref:post-GPI attachment to proteins factor 2 isoform X1 n=1 Tax=Drosophila teissieri TaxID=7243 RepID=UPI001CBA4ED4|nr:post-GPI attachment to proteins factor 2 isoform X1 [Drosophila teissieri]
MRHFAEDQAKLLPSSIKDVQARRHFRIPVGPPLALGLLQMPVGMAYNLVMAITTDFQSTTYTSCHAFNIFPTTSAAAKSQHKVWALVCWLEFPFLIANAWLLIRFYRRNLPRPVRSFGCLMAIVMAVSSFSMLLWGNFAQEDGDSLLHIAIALSLFASCAIYMAGSFVCAKYYMSESSGLMHEELSLRLKSGLVLTYYMWVVIMWIFYFLHQKFCFPLAYSVFGIGEFISCECFFIYLSTAYFDFYHVYICYDQRLGFFLSEL